MATQAFDFRGEYDENLPLPASLTLAQYRHVFFRPDAHFMDGAIVPRHLGDSTHGRTVVSLTAISTQVPEFQCCVSLRLQILPNRIRVCDFVVLAPGAPREEVPSIPPLLCIEVLSPNQAAEDELDVLADYLAMGVPNIWLVDPIRRSAYIFDSAGLHEADPTNLTISNTPIHLDLTAAFAALD